MTVVQVGVAPEHLAVKVADVIVEVFRKSTGFTEPVLASKRGEGDVEVCGSGGDWSVGARGICLVSGGVCGRIIPGRVDWEEADVGDFAQSPLLN